jgi:hypothetical protein
MIHSWFPVAVIRRLHSLRPPGLPITDRGSMSVIAIFQQVTFRPDRRRDATPEGWTPNRRPRWLGSLSLFFIFLQFTARPFIGGCPEGIKASLAFTYPFECGNHFLECFDVLPAETRLLRLFALHPSPGISCRTFASASDTPPSSSSARVIVQSNIATARQALYTGIMPLCNGTQDHSDDDCC